MVETFAKVYQFAKIYYHKVANHGQNGKIVSCEKIGLQYCLKVGMV